MTECQLFLIDSHLKETFRLDKKYFNDFMEHNLISLVWLLHTVHT